MAAIRVLQVSGTFYEMGYQHGQAYLPHIHELVAERLALCMDEVWTGRRLSRERVLGLVTACETAHRAYSPELYAELEGMAAATGLSVGELIIAGGFTDFVDVLYNAEPTPAAPEQAANNCTTFMIGNAYAQKGLGMAGQTWDMHATATPYVILLHGQPQGLPSFLVFTLTGCPGMIGMNSAGLCVGINNLMGADGVPGVTWPFVVRKILMQDNLQDALCCITEAPLAGGHNYFLMDEGGAGYMVEAMSTTYHIEPLENGILTHANQCNSNLTCAVERPLTPELMEDSQARQGRAATLLQRRPVSPEDLMALTRDRSDGSFSICSLPEPPYYSQTCGAVIMRPASREFWGVWGLPSENEYERFVL
ncbi:MAG: hypothetical protein HC915_15020 [Anaerolineae bacterium]|nr:hypothetical protein [Anaerolineae bacterium]